MQKQLKTSIFLLFFDEKQLFFMCILPFMFLLGTYTEKVKMITVINLPAVQRSSYGYIYFAKIDMLGESFTKVGFSRDPATRFTSKAAMEEFNELSPFDDILIEFMNVIPMEEWMFEDEYRPEYYEQKLHGALRYSGLQYIPDFEFSGMSECYCLSTTDYKAAIDYLEETLQWHSPPNGWGIDY
ncbi:hypothetical protein [Aeromonas dhakensis]|uniref:hypothetical protein n=1 Tax=Aeromonas dhakensis TaxID=196024 RepID=UPI0012FD3ECC|nr:hypothetical protein [Aeromonas dhakensis]